VNSRLRIAAIFTIYYPISHADAIVSKFFKGMSTDEVFLCVGDFAHRRTIFHF